MKLHYQNRLIKKVHRIDGIIAIGVLQLGENKFFGGKYNEFSLEVYGADSSNTFKTKRSALINANLLKKEMENANSSEVA